MLYSLRGYSKRRIEIKNMQEETLSLIPRSTPLRKPTTPVVMHVARSRFEKLGDNADHPYTVRMRAIKEELRLTTRQLVEDLNLYEREFHADKFYAEDENGKPAMVTMNTVLMSSYLQGWVMQKSYMSSVRKRLENFYKHKKSQQGGLSTNQSICVIMDRWFKVLGIDPKSTTVSPFRQFAKLIGPFYKRPVLVSLDGEFSLGQLQDGLRLYTLIDAEGVPHEFSLNPNEPVLIKDKQQVKTGDVIQYSVLMGSQIRGGQAVVTDKPSIDHTTFFRWYTNNKMPRSIKTIELIQAAVDEAVKANLK